MHRVAPRHRSAWVVVAGVTVLVATGLLRAVVSRSAQTPAASHDMAGMNMSDDMMIRMYRAKAHPSRAGFPAGVNQTLVVADSFVASGFRFSEDNNSATVIDTAHIQVGDAIRFKWGSGFHSVTSGAGSLDPNSGLLFNVDPFQSAADNFDFQFSQAGVYPFYCLYHESSNMKGVVVVGSVDAAPPIAVGAPKVGFVAPPMPNPTRYDATFRIGLASAGHTRIDVLDLEGRRVASVFDRDMPAGTFVARWDGSLADGRPAAAGIYLIRLRGPGVNESRRVTLER